MECFCLFRSLVRRLFFVFFDQLKPNFIALGLEEENVISFDENKSFLRTGGDGERNMTLEIFNSVGMN